MSAPRFIVPGVTYLLTRRCFGRQFFLRPNRKLNQIFEFCLAVAAARSGCEIHAYCMLSNHYHLVVTDVEGNLPIFMHWFNEYIAKCVNRRLGRWESFWAPGSYSQVALTDREDVIEKLVYTYTNPVSAGLVRSFRHWPGARSTPREMAEPGKVIDRPKGFFRAGGPVPSTQLLKLRLPRGFGGHSSWIHLEERVGNREAELRKEFRKKNQPFLGRFRVLKQSHTSRPKSREPRRGLNPRVAGRDRWRRVEALQHLKQFLFEYRTAWRRFAEGDRSIKFPFGTYAMRVQLKVMCCGP